MDSSDFWQQTHGSFGFHAAAAFANNQLHQQQQQHNLQQQRQLQQDEHRHTHETLQQYHQLQEQQTSLQLPEQEEPLLLFQQQHQHLQQHQHHQQHPNTHHHVQHNNLLFNTSAVAAPHLSGVVKSNERQATKTITSDDDGEDGGGSCVNDTTATTPNNSTATGDDIIAARAAVSIAKQDAVAATTILKTSVSSNNNKYEQHDDAPNSVPLNFNVFQQELKQQLHKQHHLLDGNSTGTANISTTTITISNNNINDDVNAGDNDDDDVDEDDDYGDGDVFSISSIKEDRQHQDPQQVIMKQQQQQLQTYSLHHLHHQQHQQHQLHQRQHQQLQQHSHAHLHSPTATGATVAVTVADDNNTNNIVVSMQLPHEQQYRHSPTAGAQMTLPSHSAQTKSITPPVASSTPLDIKYENNSDKVVSEIQISFSKTAIEKRKIALAFYMKHDIPGVIGCIDGTHIRIIAPSSNKHLYYNKKGYYSLNAVLVCDNELKIHYGDASHPGACHDAFICNADKSPETGIFAGRSELLAPCRLRDIH